MNDLWTEYTLEERIPYFWQLGQRQLWVMHKNDEWFVAHNLLCDESQDNLVCFEEREKPQDISWNRILCRTEDPRIRLAPQTPDKPVVVGSQYPVSIMPKNQGMFFILFRSWISLQVGAGFKHSIAELPTINLSNSWFGDPATGISCYSLKTSARRGVSEEHIPGYKIICPVRIVNQSPEPLDFQRFCVHVEHLKIYSTGARLWSNEVRILYQGEDKGSILKYSEGPPDVDDYDSLTLMRDYRVSPRPNLLKRSLSIIKNLTDWTED